MKALVKSLYRRGYLAGYAALVAVTLTLALLCAYGGAEPAYAQAPAATGSRNIAAARKKPSLKSQRNVLRGVMLAQAGALPIRGEGDGKKPNIVIIMGDDIGMWNIGAYHRGLMAGRTPNTKGR